MKVKTTEEIGKKWNSMWFVNDDKRLRTPYQKKLAKFEQKKWIDVEQLIKWIQSRQIDGTMCIAKTDFLKGQKNGELMMLKKMYDAITSTSHNTDYDFGSKKEPQPKGKDASQTSVIPLIKTKFAKRIFSI